MYAGADDDHRVTVVLRENQVFGERALEKDERRRATIIANTNKTICLMLSKKDYKDIVYVRCIKPIIFIARLNLAESKATIVFAKHALL